MKDWQQIARASGMEMDAAPITPALDALEAAFRPLVAAIPWDTDPAFVFRPLEEGE